MAPDTADLSVRLSERKQNEVGTPYKKDKQENHTESCVIKESGIKSIKLKENRTEYLKKKTVWKKENIYKR